MIAVDVSAITEIEEALFAQWSHFGRWRRGRLHDADGLLWFETPITHLPYNAVLRTHLADGAAGEAIASLVERFRGRGVQYFWLVHPSATPADLADRLAAHGLQAVERITGMSLELAGWEAAGGPRGVDHVEVLDDDALSTYVEFTARHWEISDEERDLVMEIHRHWGPGRIRGHRYLAVADGQAVGKGYLSLDGPPGVASIYGMFVPPEARGRGIASGLAGAMLARARALGGQRVVLHATAMAVGLYRRAGFTERCTMDVFATTALWSDEH